MVFLLPHIATLPMAGRIQASNCLNQPEQNLNRRAAAAEPHLTRAATITLAAVETKNNAVSLT